MNRVFLIFIFLFLTDCEKQNHQFCNVGDPKNDLEWLRNIIELSETDETGNYWGWIWGEVYLDKDVIFVEMPMGSGGLLGYWFNCDGSKLVYSTDNKPKLTRKNLIYSKIP